MALQAVVRKDFEDSIRSYTLAALVLLFAAFATFLAAIQWIPLPYQDSTVEKSTLALLNSMRQPTVFLVPVISLAVAYDTIAGERESGSLRLLLGLPNSRADVVFGKFIGRVGVVAVAILVGYATAALVALATYDSFSLRIFVLYTLLTVLYGAVYTALATGFSAAMRSRTRALVGATGVYSLVILGWDAILYGIPFVVFGDDFTGADIPNWLHFLGLVNPSTAFMHASRAVIPEYREITFHPTPDVFYMQDWVGIPILLFWVVVPLAFGYLRFDATDIQ